MTMSNTLQAARPSLVADLAAAAEQPWLWLAAVIAPLALMSALLTLAPAGPAPLTHDGARFLALAAMGVGMVGAASGRRWPTALIVNLLTLLLVHWSARLAGMPMLAHPASTTLAMMMSSLCFLGLGALIGRAAPKRAVPIALCAGLAEAVLGGILWPLPQLPEALAALAHLSPVRWSVVAVQTALTGTGTRAAAIELVALGGLGISALLATWLWQHRLAKAALLLGWLMLASLSWQSPGPLPPVPDMAIATMVPMPPDDGRIAPIASTAPDPALASALARIEQQMDTWRPASGTDPAQRTRNLLLIAAVADLYDTQPLQAHLPLLVEAELKKRLPANRLPELLGDIAAYPDRGSVSARESLPVLGLAASTGNDAAVRNRMGLYAAKFAARLP
jgi:hypothetical protein